MKKIDLTEIDQFGNVAVSRSWTTSDIKSNKFIINFGDYWYTFDYNGKLLESNQLLSSKQINNDDLLTLK